MTGESPFSSPADGLSPNRNLELPIEQGSQNSEEDVLHHECNDLEIQDGGDDDNLQLEGGDDDLELDNDCEQMFDLEMNDYEDKLVEESILDNQVDDSTVHKKDYLPPFVGMEFNSYDNAYNYYNSYAKELGFGIRVKSSWTKRNSKEKRGAVLCCNCEGFKTVKEANSRRKETRTGCLAMVRLRLIESNRWRVDELKLDHNHSFDAERAQNSKSHKRMDSAGNKRKAEPAVDVEPVQNAVSEVFPRAHHHLHLSHVIQTIFDNLIEFQDSEEFQTVLNRIVYNCSKIGDFEISWEDMKIQTEVSMMSSCISITQAPNNGSILTYHVKEEDEAGIKTSEVVYDRDGSEVRCICSCFNFNGYLCRHALCILDYNSVEEIPIQYILSRWRKDCKRLYIPDLGSDSVDITNPVQWFDHLYRRAMQVVEEGMISQDHYMVAWQAFKESLNKVRLVAADKPM
ncbi:hypothetical protein ACFE04_031628 [Oxalis oulophora]